MYTVQCVCLQENNWQTTQIYHHQDELCSLSIRIRCVSKIAFEQDKMFLICRTLLISKRMNQAQDMRSRWEKWEIAVGSNLAQNLYPLHWSQRSHPVFNVMCSCTRKEMRNRRNIPLPRWIVSFKVHPILKLLRPLMEEGRT